MPKLKQAQCYAIQKLMWNEVMLWLTQTMGYNACIPLLIVQMNDAEEILYPTIFDVPDLTTLGVGGFFFHSDAAIVTRISIAASL